MPDATPKLDPPWEVFTVLDPTQSVSLRYATYCTSKNPKRWFVFLNGRTEWIEKYAELPASLHLPADCGFLALDHRGQGGSGGRKGFIDTYATYARDAQFIVDRVVKNAPYVLMGHSMGSLIALYSTLIHALTPQRLLLGSPLLRLPARPFPAAVSKVVATALEKIGMGDLHSGAGRYEKTSFVRNRLTQDIAMFERIKHSPFKMRSATFAWVNRTFAATDLVFQPDLLRKFSIPTLVLSASDESVVDPRGISDWLSVATGNSPAMINLEIVHGARHELFAEIPKYREQSITKVLHWFKDFLA